MQNDISRLAHTTLLAALLVAAPGWAVVPPAAPAPHLVDATVPAAPAETSLDRIAEKWLTRKGAVELAHARFQAQKESLADVRRRLAAVPEPEAKSVPPVTRAADVDTAIKVAGQLAEYHATRARLFEEIVTGEKELLARSEDFDRAVKQMLTERDTVATAIKSAGQGIAVPDAITPKQVDAVATRGMSLAAEVNKERDRVKGDLPGAEATARTGKATSTVAAAALAKLTAVRDAQLAAFAFQERIQAMKPEQLVAEFHQLRKTLAEKRGAIQGDAADVAKSADMKEFMVERLKEVKWDAVADTRLDPSLPLLEQTARRLFAAQQQYGTRIRVMQERVKRTRTLVAALDDLEMKTIAYVATLAAAQGATTQLATVAAEIELRIGRGELEAAKSPEGVAPAAGSEGLAKLDADAADARDSLAEIRRGREMLRKPDPESENIHAMTVGLLTLVNTRIELLAERDRLVTAAATARKDRTDAERQRLNERATARLMREENPWEALLALDRSARATALERVLDTYYQELIDIDELNENLRKQQDTLEKAIELTIKEMADVAKLRAVEKPAEMNNEVQAWHNWLAQRQSASGLREDVRTQYEELARLSGVRIARERRTEALTGQLTPEKLVTGGEIGRVRAELHQARVRGLTITGIKIALVLLSALILPRLIVFILRRSIRGGSDAAGNPSPALGALRSVLRLGAWIAALAISLKILGFDVTALVVALAIGVLAVALAARPMLSDLLGSLVIFAERRFKMGDVVRLAGGEPARVVGITWRSTTLKNASGLMLSVPNRTVTETEVENRSRGGDTYDSLAVTISTDKDAARVIQVIRGAMVHCKNLTPEHGVAVVSYNQRESLKVVQYRFWWFLKDYEARNKTRDEVIARIAMGLASEDMSGIEITLA